MDRNNHDTSPWQSRSPSMTASSLQNGIAGRASSADTPAPDANAGQRAQPVVETQTGIAAAGEVTPTGNDNGQGLRSVSTSMHPPPLPVHRAPSSAREGSHSLRDESPMFFPDSRATTREPSAAPYPQPPPYGEARSLRSESPLFVLSREQTLEPQAQADPFQQTNEPQVQTQAQTSLALQPPLPSGASLLQQLRPTREQRSLRSESPLFVESRQQTLEPQPQVSIDPLPRALMSPPGGRMNAPTPSPEAQDEGSLFMPSRETTAAPQPQPAPLPQPPPQSHAESAPLVETVPTPNPAPPQTGQRTASTRGSEISNALRNRMSSEEQLHSVLEQWMADHPDSDVAAQLPTPQPTQPTLDANAAASAVTNTESRPNKRRNAAGDGRDGPAANNAPESSSPQRATKKQKTAGNQTGKRRRGQERAGTPAPQSERHVEDDGPGGQDNSSAENSEGAMDNRLWMQRAQQASRHLRGSRAGREGGLSQGRRGETVHRGRASGPGPGSNSGRGTSPSPGRPGSLKSHNITALVDDKGLEMPARKDFLYGYGRLLTKHFKWGPKEEEVSTGGRAPRVAPYPQVGEMTPNHKGCPAKPKAKRHKQQAGEGTAQASAASSPRLSAHQQTATPRPPGTLVPAHQEGSTGQPDVFIKERPPSLLFFSPEVRENIWRYLLLANKAILVDRKWTRVCRVMRPGRGAGRDSTPLDLHPAILSTCKVFAQEALGVLYGENTFRYRMRESLSVLVIDNDGKADDNDLGRDGDHDEEADGGAHGLDDDGDDDGEYVDEDDDARTSPSRDRGSRLINIERYYHLVRHIAVEIEQNRTSRDVMASVAEAIKVFSDRVVSPCTPTTDRTLRQSNIHTLKLIIHPTITNNAVVSFTFTDFFVASSPLIKAMRALHAQFVYIDVMSVFLNRHQKNVRLVVDLRPRRRWNQLMAGGGGVGTRKMLDKAFRWALLSSIQTSDRVMSRLDKHVKAACEQYDLNKEAFHSPYCWFVSDLEEDEYDYMF